jgi:hypothetical protein
MAERIDPQELSQAELDEYLDRLTREGKDDTPEFRRAFNIWEKNQ